MISGRVARWLGSLLAFATTLRASAFAQGCAQCLDNTAATPPATQAAFRHAIILLASTAALVFAAGVVLMRRSR